MTRAASLTAANGPGPAPWPGAVVTSSPMLVISVLTLVRTLRSFLVGVGAR
jgi:hypothetical protein